MTRSMFWHAYYLIEITKVQDKLISEKESTNKTCDEETKLLESKDVPIVK